MSSVVERWTLTEVWLPCVLSDKELIAFAVEHDDAMEGLAPFGLRDFVCVLRVTEGRKIRRLGSAGHAIETGTSTTVRLLSPTHEFIDEALTVLGINHTPGEREVASVDPNCTSIVLWVDSGDRDRSSGADLEATENGWTSVVDAHDPGCSLASVVRVPHHGSEDADEPRTWERMCSDRTFDVTTRYTRLKEPLPRAADVKRLCRQGGRAACGGRPSCAATPRCLRSRPAS